MCRPVVGRQAGGKDHAEPSARAEQRERALDEQLIKVDVPVPLRPVHPGSTREGGQLLGGRPGCVPGDGVAPIASQHLPGWIADDRVEARARERLATGVAEDLRKLECPVEETLPRRDVSGLGDERFGDVDGKAPPSEDLVSQRPERHRRPIMASPEPRATPQIADLFPALDGRVAAGQRCQRVLLGADLLERVARFRRDARPDGNRVFKREILRDVFEER